MATVIAAASLGVATLLVPAAVSAEAPLQPLAWEAVALPINPATMAVSGPRERHVSESASVTSGDSDVLSPVSPPSGRTTVAVQSPGSGDIHAEVEVGDDDEQWSLESDVVADLGVPISSQGNDVAVDCDSMLGPLLCED